MTQSQENPVTSLDHVLDQWKQAWPSAVPADDDALGNLADRLLDREDQMVGVLHLAGAQFGLFPQIVAEVLAEVGLGRPRSDEERTMIRQRFNELMDQVRRAQAGEGPMPTP